MLSSFLSGYGAEAVFTGSVRESSIGPTKSLRNAIFHRRQRDAAGFTASVAACPSSSIRQNLFEDDQIFSEIKGVLANV